MTKKIQAVLCASISAVLYLAGCAPHKQVYQQPQMPQHLLGILVCRHSSPPLRLL